MNIYKNKEEALNEYPNFKNDINLISDNKKVIIGAFDLDSFKSNKQNSLFHGLLSLYWDSGCSSFISYDEMREHYKKIAGLIDMETISPLSQETKYMLYKAIKLLPMSEEEKIKTYTLLKGIIKKEKSWSSVSKEDAKRAIDSLLHDMDQSNVIGSSQGKKYEYLLKQIGLWFGDII